LQCISKSLFTCSVDFLVRTASTRSNAKTVSQAEHFHAIGLLVWSLKTVAVRTGIAIVSHGPIQDASLAETTSPRALIQKAHLPWRNIPIALTTPAARRSHFADRYETRFSEYDAPRKTATITSLTLMHIRRFPQPNPCVYSRRGRAEIRFSVMEDKREIWMQLAELAANEKDPEKLSALVKEINRLLAEKQDRLNRAQIPSKPSE